MSRERWGEACELRDERGKGSIITSPKANWMACRQTMPSTVLALGAEQRPPLRREKRNEWKDSVSGSQGRSILAQNWKGPEGDLQKWSNQPKRAERVPQSKRRPKETPPRSRSGRGHGKNAHTRQGKFAGPVGWVRHRSVGTGLGARAFRWPMPGDCC